MKINFEAGTNERGCGINFMASLADRDLYAEIEVPEGASEDFGYLVLKEQIIAQAAEKGIKEPLEFWYDGQEKMLAKDADGKLRGYWYAVQRSSEDDWGAGSYDLDEAKRMARDLKWECPDALIAVIDESGENPVCVREIEVEG